MEFEDFVFDEKENYHNNEVKKALADALNKIKETISTVADSFSVGEVGSSVDLESARNSLIAFSEFFNNELKDLVITDDNGNIFDGFGELKNDTEAEDKENKKYINIAEFKKILNEILDGNVSLDYFDLDKTDEDVNADLENDAGIFDDDNSNTNDDSADDDWGF